MTTMEHEHGTPQMGTLIPEFMDSITREGVSINDIPGYIPPSQPRAHARKPTKNQRYPIKMPTIPERMVYTFNIVPALM